MEVMQRLFITFVLLLSSRGILASNDHLFNEPGSPILELNAEAHNKAIRSGEPWAIVYYSPYCGHCQHFAPRGKDAAAALKGSGINFGAVSCAAEGDTCREADVHGYPTFKAYALPDIEQGGKIETGEVDKMVDWFKKHLPAKEGSRHQEEEKEDEQQRQQQKQQNGNEAEVVPPPAAAYLSENQPRHVRREPVRGMGRHSEAEMESKKGLELTRIGRSEDAFTSIRFTFDNEVFLGTNTLEGPALDSLRGFLHVLNLSFPGATRRAAFGQLRGELQHVDHITMHDWKEKVVQHIHPLVEQPKVYEYQICGDNPGYTCGLWSLFHILSVKSGEGEISPVMAMEAIHRFVEHFLHCETCRNHFLASYDNRSFGRSDIAESDMDNRGVVLWLWRLHNAVNIRTALDTTTERPLDLSDILWPVCDVCWDKENIAQYDTSLPFKEDEYTIFIDRVASLNDIYHRLVSNYRIVDIHLKHRENNNEDPESLFWNGFLGGAICIVGGAILFVMVLGKVRQKSRIGRYKKRERNPTLPL